MCKYISEVTGVSATLGAGVVTVGHGATLSYLSAGVAGLVVEAVSVADVVPGVEDGGGGLLAAGEGLLNGCYKVRSAKDAFKLVPEKNTFLKLSFPSKEHSFCFL